MIENNMSVQTYFGGLEGYCCTENIDGKYRFIFMQHHPTPSGNPRHILRFSSNVLFDMAEEALKIGERNRDV